MGGEYAYLAGDKAGLEVIDISNPEEPEFVGSVGTLSEVHGVAQSGDIVLAADYRYGLSIFPIQCAGPTAVSGGTPAAIVRLSACPNPVIAGTVIEWRGATSGAHLRLYDPLGRLVATRGVEASGELRWTELVDHSAPSSGVYFLELRTPGGQRQAARLVVAR
jgi:hypothetical protein